MEDFMLKAFELGALGAVTFFLLIRGTSAIKTLADSNTSLAEAVKALTDKINNMDNRVAMFEQRVENRLDALENTPILLKEVTALTQRLNDLDNRLSNFETKVLSLFAMGDKS